LKVSILVLVDFSLKLPQTLRYKLGKTVSILVLVDFSLKLFFGFFCLILLCSFNPCFGGFFSKTQFLFLPYECIHPVSILVLVDFSLKPETKPFSIECFGCFNPCFGGFFSKTLKLRSYDD